MHKIETCRFCGESTIPKGRHIFKGREVDMIGCKSCGIARMVATKDLPLVETAFKCATRKCEQNIEGWCKLDQPCSSFLKPAD